MVSTQRTSIINRRQFLQTTLAGTAGIVLGTNYAEAQNTNLSPQQQETIAQLRDGIHRIYRNQPNVFSEHLQGLLDENTDPMLIGQYVVFNTNWLQLVGNGRDHIFTRQQFQTWRNSLDRLYECYEKFVGQKPLANMLFILLLPGRFVGAAAGGAGLGAVFRDNSHDSFRGMLANNVQCFVTMHEVAHNFTSIIRHPSWFADGEGVADFLVYHAIENCGFRVNPSMSGPQNRRASFQRILGAFQNNNNIEPFRAGPSGPHANRNNAYEFYMYGLVDVVGWEAFGRAIRSYHNGTYTATKRYDPGERVPNRFGGNRISFESEANARAHEFFDRVAHFHDLARQDPVLARSIPAAGRNLTGTQALRSLPDKGRLLDEHFTVQTTPLTGTNNNTATPRSPVADPSYQPPGKDIFEAATRGTADDIEHHVKNGADANAKNEAGDTPLHLAAANNPDANVLRRLFAHKADAKAYDKDYHTPLMRVPQNGAGAAEKRVVIHVNGGR